MNCVEFESVLPEYLEGAHTSEQQAHLDSCPACSGLLSDLNLISAQAKLLIADDEPRAAVWDALESRLRSEGLIRSSEPVPIAFPAKARLFPRWRMAWLVPVAAVLVIAVGLKLRHPAGAGDNAPIAKQTPVATDSTTRTASAKTAISREDQQWLKAVADRPPAQLAKFRTDLDQANAFIEDAQQSLQHDPNDFYMQQMLLNAYEQKQMLYQLAVDRSSQ